MKHMGNPLLPIALCLGASIVAAASEAKPRSAQAQARTIERLFEAFNRHDAKAMAALYADNAVLESPDYCTPVRGRAAIERVYNILFREISDVRDDVETMVVDGNKAAVQFQSRGTQAGTPFEVKIATFFTFADGKIVHDATYFDSTEPCRTP